MGWINKIYNNFYFPRFFCKRTDGGEESAVTAYFLIEWKPVLSIALLNFKSDTRRENYHSHAFHAITWWLYGRVIEERMYSYEMALQNEYAPSIIPKFTSINNMHKIKPQNESVWALTFRGPWMHTWLEFNSNSKKLYTLSNRRQIINTISLSEESDENK